MMCSSSNTDNKSIASEKVSYFSFDHLYFLYSDLQSELLSVVHVLNSTTIPLCKSLNKGSNGKFSKFETCENNSEA